MSIADSRPLIGISRADIEEIMAALGAPRFRAAQLWQWIYRRGLDDFAQMHTLPQSLRGQLSSRYTLLRPDVRRALHSTDGTRKWLLGLADENEIETVFIPNVERRGGALCVSSQVGCTLTCRFCHTGTQRLVRNLSAGEIVGQWLLACDALGEWNASESERQLTTLVLMGMGEPLFNYDDVAAALHILMDPEGIALSRNRITLSTSGVAPMIARCGEELGVNLAISLHAVHDDLRNALVPLNKKYPIAEVLDACRRYPSGRGQGRITFEYVMLKDVNDSPEEARELVRLIQGIPAKINLIPFNPWPGAPYERSTPEKIRAFADIVGRAGYASPVRTPRGEDILAACGQLKSASERKTACHG